MKGKPAENMFHGMTVDEAHGVYRNISKEYWAHLEACYENNMPQHLKDDRAIQLSKLGRDI